MFFVILLLVSTATVLAVFRLGNTSSPGNSNIAQKFSVPATSGLPTEIDATVSADSQVAIDQPTDRPIVVHENGYVGSQSCRECHADEYTGWHASYHRTMTQVATPESVIGDFNDVVLTLFGQEIRLTREGDKFFYEGPDPDWTGPQSPHLRIKRQIVQTTGSHHMQVYWYVFGKNRMLGSVPVTWLKEDARWVWRESVFLRPRTNKIVSETGRWNMLCLRCHTTHPQTGLEWADQEASGRKTVENFDTHVGEFGIACEACHGPGEQHVQWHESGKQHQDSQLVVPTQLNAQLSSQVCGQCHSVWDFNGEDAFYDWLKHGFQYRPGDELNNDMRTVVRSDSDSPMLKTQFAVIAKDSKMWSDGMVRVSGREYNGLIESPCFNHADESKRMSCLSCHTLHPDTNDKAALASWADDQLGPGMRTNQACTQCHEDYRDEKKLISHTHHPAGSSGSLCYNCHMPYTSYGLLKAIRSHTIDSPTVQASVATGRPNACNQCHLDKTLAWSASYLNRWYKIAEPKLDKDEQTIAASILWTLKGDAGQRALMAWSMGWPDARAVSKTDWMTPYLAQLMGDDYDAVRFIAARTIHKQKGFEQLKFDPFAPVQRRNNVVKQMVRNGGITRSGDKIRTVDSQLLFDRDGQLLGGEFSRLLKARDRRPVNLQE